MGKKNTLLYLDEELVETAKRLGLNLSNITESAIKSAVFPQLSEGERRLIDFEGYLEDLKKQKRCFSLPFQIKKLELENIGPIRNFETAFDSFNFVVGPNASGKTTLIRSITYACGFDEAFGEVKRESKKDPIITRGEEKGEISVTPALERKLTVKLGKGSEKNVKSGCLLFDDPLTRFDRGQAQEAIQHLKELSHQIIATSTIPLEEKCPEVQANIIELPNPEDEN